MAISGAWRAAWLPAALLLAALAPGCASGLLYTDVVEPLTADFHGTPIGERRGESAILRVQDIFTSARLSAEWSSTAIADAARQGGLQRIYYAELRTQAYVFGLFRRRTVVVWGA